jgi:hexokinase
MTCVHVLSSIRNHLILLLLSYLQTVGALLSRSYTAGSCILGGIFGTGTNGAYLEDMSKIKKLSKNPTKGDKMIVNTEWGGFNNTVSSPSSSSHSVGFISISHIVDNQRSVLPSTPFDNKLDRESINPRFQAFEKFISGMYLGEITRNILLALVDAAPTPLLFGGMTGSGMLNKHYGVDTAIMSEIEEAWGREDANELGSQEASSVENHPNGHSKVVSRNLLNLDTENIGEKQKRRLERVKQVIIHSLGFENIPEHVSLRDAAIVRWVCTLVAERAAKLSGCAVAAVVVQTGLGTLGGNRLSAKKELMNEKQKIGVAVDGRLVVSRFLLSNSGLTRDG